jgi:hypothetical protein
MCVGSDNLLKFAATVLLVWILNAGLLLVVCCMDVLLIITTWLRCSLSLSLCDRDELLALRSAYSAERKFRQRFLTTRLIYYTINENITSTRLHPF